MSATRSKRQRQMRAEGYGPCHYCGAPGETVDHIVPLVVGGSNARINVVPACYDCNQAKGASMVDDHCATCRAAWDYARANRGGAS